MPATPFEHCVNSVRGWCCLLVTVGSIAVVLEEPASLVFWADGAYATISAPTGPFGFILAASFLAYLLVDTAVGIVCRHQFRRSMGAVFLHHALVGVAVAAFLVPSPPRGFFLYVWGEALTASRLLPPQSRFQARSVIFALRRTLWLYCGARDIWFFETTAAKFGYLPALVPPAIAVLLLFLDVMWWREHVRSGAQVGSGKGSLRRGADAKSGGIGSGGPSCAADDFAEDEAAVGLIASAAASEARHAHCPPGSKRGSSREAKANGHLGVVSRTPALRELDLEAAIEDEPENCNTP